MAKRSVGWSLLRNAVPLFGAVVMAVAIALLLKQWFGAGKPGGEAGPAPVGVTEKAAAPRAAIVGAPQSKAGAPLASNATERVLADIARAQATAAVGGTVTVVDKSEAAQERAAARWEGLVDAAEEFTAPPTVEMAETFKRAFDAMTPENKAENITYALHMLPDSQFSSLYLILFNKDEDPDILDEIFSDALNREDEIKLPLLKKIREDKEHPMWEEADRILEVILDE